MRSAALVALGLLGCAPLFHGGAATRPDPKSTPAEHAKRADAIERSVELLLGVIADPTVVARVRAELAAARIGTMNHEREVVDDVDELVAIFGDIRAPGALPRLGATFIPRGVELMQKQLPVFRDAADTFPDDTLLGARVAMFVYRYPTEMAFAGAMTIDSVGPGRASGTVSVPTKEPKTAPDAKTFLDEAHTRMARVVASQPTDDRAWLLAGRMCRLEHEPVVDASCEPILAHCVAFPACKQEHDFFVRELRPRGCTRVGVDPNIELRGASEATSGVPFDGKNYKLDADVFLEPKDIERVVEASAERAFTLPSSTSRAGYEWEPVVRLNLTLDAATRAGKAYATLASRNATLLLLKDGNPIGAMPAMGPWDADVYPFFQMQNVPIDRVCVNVSP